MALINQLYVLQQVIDLNVFYDSFEFLFMNKFYLLVAMHDTFNNSAIKIFYFLSFYSN